MSNVSGLDSRILRQSVESDREERIKLCMSGGGEKMVRHDRLVLIQDARQPIVGLEKGDSNRRNTVARCRPSPRPAFGFSTYISKRRRLITSIQLDHTLTSSSHAYDASCSTIAC